MNKRVQAKIIPVILSGGSGERLWPLSRAKYPKQFVKLYSEMSLIQETALRCQALGYQEPIILCNAQHQFLIEKQLAEININDYSMILEPAARNTAPAIAMASHYAQAKYPNQEIYLLVLPSDQFMQNCNPFGDAVKNSIAYAAQNNLITFGIKPDSPNINYGYIELDSDNALINQAHPIKRFIEKPPLADAKKYYQDHHYYWNGGIFLFSPETYLTELRTYQPELAKQAQNSWNQSKNSITGNLVNIDQESFTKCESISIDYAVMEKSKQVACTPISSDWSDIGTWSALWEISPKDQDNNATRGRVITDNCKNNYLHSESRLIGAADLEDIVVVETKDAILVSKNDSNSKIKNITKQIKEQELPEIKEHLKDYRPWGSYEILDEGPNYKVKHIIVNPGCILSLQMHHHRAEHWVIVKGLAEVTLEDKVFQLKENESTFIPLQAKHRIANPGKEPMHFIEVQSGSYLGEDDIVRFEDQYGRAPEPARSTV